MISLVALQTAEVAKLKADLSVPVYGVVPENEGYPYVKIGPKSAENIGSKHSSIEEVTSTIEVYSEKRDWAEAAGLMEEVIGSLAPADRSVLTLSGGWRHINARFEGWDTLDEEVDPAGQIILHGQVRIAHKVTDQN